MDTSFTPAPALTSLSMELGNLLICRNMRCSVAESCTGGMVGAAISAIAGSSSWFTGGIIAYDNDVKIRLLNVPQQTIAQNGAVSAETVEAMAAGVAALMHTECAVSVSGIAGPSGGSPEKPTGLVYIGIIVCDIAAHFRHIFPGNRAEVRAAATEAALRHLIDRISA